MEKSKEKTSLKNRLLSFSKNKKWIGALLLPMLSAFHVFVGVLTLAYAVIFVRWYLFIFVLIIGIRYYFKMTKKTRWFYLKHLQWDPWPYYIFEYVLDVIVYLIIYTLFTSYIITVDPGLIYEQAGASLLYAIRLLPSFFFLPCAINIIIFWSRKVLRMFEEKRNAGSQKDENIDKEDNMNEEKDNA